MLSIQTTMNRVNTKEVCRMDAYELSLPVIDTNWVSPRWIRSSTYMRQADGFELGGHEHWAYVTDTNNRHQKDTKRSCSDRYEHDGFELRLNDGYEIELFPSICKSMCSAQMITIDMFPSRVCISTEKHKSDLIYIAGCKG